MSSTLYNEIAEVITHTAYPADQYSLSLRVPNISQHAEPGNFVHIQCDELLPMRRPMSIMRTDKKKQTIDILYKVNGKGTRLLANKSQGAKICLLGPVGNSFGISETRTIPLLIGGGVGIPPMIFLAEHIKRLKKQLCPLVLMGSEIPFPFSIRPSSIMLPDMPEQVIASVTLLEDWGIPSRLASMADYQGCYHGYVTELASTWLKKLADSHLAEVEIFACGPTPMLKSVANLAAEYRLPCQLSLEEYMPCAVGGCAGCAIPVKTRSKIEMKRVCVDGPIFEANTVFLTD